ncbi:multicopper oxidase domain-containing protein [Nitrosococcus wardiae]|uniref:Copper oxidase n=1 Tax=Nitrosococcus wardiae TaxID=1814290 RepID=A0A4V1AW25_9GAMM|nr:multicopper oxidase domain-containing protein [Nitrosococcus wardiae]QBQ55155.1 copper oxidase [Nitrosococcus wardiae]
MKAIVFGLKKKTTMALMLLATMLVSSNLILAATYNFEVFAKPLPNGQLGYVLDSEDADAIIPGPTLFVKKGDTINITLTNKTDVAVGINIPGLHEGAAEAVAGGSQSYSFTADQVGTHPYYDEGSQMLGLFGAIVVDAADGTVQSYVDDDGTITAVKRSDLDKEYIMYMVGSTFWGAEIVNDTQTPLWTNPVLGAVLGDVVRFHVLSIGHDHTFHLHAHRWLDEIAPANQGSAPSIIDVKLLTGKVDSHAFTVKAGSGVGAGMWHLHCHLVSHMESGMTGRFRVDDDPAAGNSIAGASPYGAILLGATDDPGLVTFEISDEPGSWFRSARANDLAPITKTRSLEVIAPGSSAHFIMSDTNAVHTITTLLWPSDADDPLLGNPHNIPFDQTKAYRGGAIVQLDTPGLYVFTCKIHPYMFGAVIVDDPETEGLDLGTKIDLVTGVNGLPTISDLATRLLRTFFVATTQENWQDYTSSAPWTVSYPDVEIAIGDLDGNIVDNVPLKGVLEARYGQDIKLDPLSPPGDPGVGEVWIDTQFEKTAGKTKPGTITVLDATHWTIKRKIALPGINMNHPHNMWSNAEQSVIYQTQWFDNKLTMIDRESGAMLHNTRVGDAPSHVMTLPNSDDITVAINGENGISVIPAEAIDWTLKRKIALPGINKNHPPNRSNTEQSIIDQTPWFGDTPSRVMALSNFEDITVAINGENSISGIPAGTIAPQYMIPTQLPGQIPANPHGHWISADGSKIVTPNINTSDTGIYDASTGQIIARSPAGGIFPAAPHPIAIGMGIDKIYTTNLLDHSMNVYQLDGTPVTTINLVADYDPVSPTHPATLADRDGDGLVTVGVLPIQTPVDPTGRVVVTANTGGTITIVDTRMDKVVAMLPCDPGCHGVNFGAKSGGGYYAYVSSKFSNRLIVVDPDPNNDGNFADAVVAGTLSMADNSAPTDDAVVGLAGMGGQGVLPIPNVYNGWVQNLPDSWKTSLTPAQLNPVP